MKWHTHRKHREDRNWVCESVCTEGRVLMRFFSTWLPICTVWTDKPQSKGYLTHSHIRSTVCLWSSRFIHFSNLWRRIRSLNGKVQDGFSAHMIWGTSIVCALALLCVCVCHVPFELDPADRGDPFYFQSFVCSCTGTWHNPPPPSIQTAVCLSHVPCSPAAWSHVSPKSPFCFLRQEKESHESHKGPCFRIWSGLPAFGLSDR